MVLVITPLFFTIKTKLKMELATKEDYIRLEEKLDKLLALKVEQQPEIKSKALILYSDESLAERWGLTKKTVAKLLKGLAVHSISPKIKRYAEKDIAAWLETKRQDHHPDIKEIFRNLELIKNAA